jgi:Zn-dependent protease with chaperone function
MDTLTVLTFGVTIFLAAALTISAVGKLTRMPQVVENLTRAGVPLDRYPSLAALELAGAAGLLIGWWWAPIGIAAAMGVVLYFAGAVAAHLRQGDRGIGPAGFLLVVALATLVLRLVTA